jgi:hypothetical protein
MPLSLILRFGAASFLALGFASAVNAAPRFDAAAVLPAGPALLLVSDDDTTVSVPDGSEGGDPAVPDGETGGEVTYDPIIAESGVGVELPGGEEPGTDAPVSEEPGSVEDGGPVVVLDGETGMEAWTTGAPDLQRDFSPGAPAAAAPRVTRGEGGNSVLRLLMRDHQRRLQSGN